MLLATELRLAFDAQLEEIERNGLKLEIADGSIRRVRVPLTFDEAFLVMASNLPDTDSHIRPDNAPALLADLSWFQYELVRIHAKNAGMVCTYSMHVTCDERTQQRVLLMLARWDGSGSFV